MIPQPPGRVLCYFHIDLNNNVFRCLKHNVVFVSREAALDHKVRRVRIWLWTHHPLQALKEVLYANRGRDTKNA